jgi:hypothetical protein
MNKHIERLMLLATDTPEFNMGGYYWPPQYVEKFAELIVKECARLCYDKECASGSGYAQDIEEYFGVNDERTT